MIKVVNGIEVEMTPEEIAEHAAFSESLIDPVELAADIDRKVAAIYTRVGQYSEEYKLREAQALTFQAAGYEGEMPRQVAAFALRAGLDPQVATETILAQAGQYWTALDDLGDLRMRKIEVLRAETKQQAKATHAEVVAEIKVIGAALA